MSERITLLCQCRDVLIVEKDTYNLAVREARLAGWDYYRRKRVAVCPKCRAVGFRIVRPKGKVTNGEENGQRRGDATSPGAADAGDR